MKKITNNIFIKILIMILAAGLLMQLTILFKDIIFEIKSMDIIISIITILITFLTVIISLYSQSKIIRKYSIGIIGFPASGKTTLITALFNELLSKQINNHKYKITPRGSTIERINEDISKLELREKLGATTDQDLFAYRIDLKSNFKLFFKQYKLEIADCPGENTQKFTQEYGQWLHNTPFFKWVMEADVFLFVVDIAKEYESIEYHAIIVKAIRAAWMRIIDFHYDGSKSLRDKSILLVFSKSDIIIHNVWGNLTSVAATEELAFGEKMPEKIDYSFDLIDSEINKILNRYNDIILFLNDQVDNFSYHFASYFAIEKNSEKRMGLNDIVNNILPR